MPTRTLAAGLAVALFFLLLASWSWLRWTDPQIDYGAELYLAWRISAGDALYGDLAHRHGPLSHHWNALLFALFGVSLGTLVWANLAVLAGICGLAFAILRRAAGARAATLCVLTLLGVFGFSQYVGIANYNYVTPYHHAQTHGVLLGLGLILALLRALETRGVVPAGCAGLCLGASLLTKAELAVPALATAGVGLVLLAARGGAAARAPALALGAGALAPPLAAFLVLAGRLPTELALEGVLGNFAHLGPALAGDAFYRTGAGLDAPGRNLLRILRASLALTALCAGLVAADRALVVRRAPAWLGPLLAAALFFALAWAAPPASWHAAGATLPVVAAGAAVGSARALVRARDPARSRRRVAWLLWSVWSLTLLGKLLLLPRLHHYGFALAMPATLLLVALLVDRLPALARRAGGDGRFARGAAFSLIAVALLGSLRLSDAHYDRKRAWAGPAGDAIRVDARTPRGARLAELHRRLERRLEPGDTLLVLPEGAMLNYWLRAENPSRFLLFLPTELDAFGREAVLADLRRAAPDWVVLLHRDAAEFGVGRFGRDPRNGREILAWVRAAYEPVERVGPPPFRGRGFGAEIWRRRPAADRPRAGKDS